MSDYHVPCVSLQPPFVSGGDKLWIAALPQEGIVLGDTREAPARSTLLLREDGLLLGPRHAVHADILRVGCGRYSHWHDNLLFSTSDGSNPNVNGRVYSVEIGEATPSVRALGGCHLYGALSDLSRKGRVFLISPDPVLSYSPREALLLLQHRPGQMLPWMPVASSLPSSDRDAADIAFLEFGTSIDVAYGSSWIPRGFLASALLEPISNLGRAERRLVRRWFHLGLLKQDEAVRTQCAPGLRPLLSQIDGDKELLSDIIVNARGDHQSPYEVAKTIGHIVDALGAKTVCVVSACNAFTPDGRALTWPVNFPKQLDAICKSLGLPLLHPSNLVAKHGGAFSIEHDLHHFTPQFMAVLGEELLTLARASSMPSWSGYSAYQSGVIARPQW